MLQMIQYANGEARVIDRERMIATEFLHSGELACRMEDYELDCELSEEDLAMPYTVLRDETRDYGKGPDFARVPDRPANRSYRRVRE